jgi:hypothetical protein
MTRAAWSLLGYWASFSWCQLRDRYSAAKRRPNLGQGALRHVRYLAGLGDSAETEQTRCSLVWHPIIVASKDNPFRPSFDCSIFWRLFKCNYAPFTAGLRRTMLS